jgi:hypothetical protein
MGLQIDRWECNGKTNQKWDITQESDTGVTTITSVFNQMCWDNYDAILGQRLNQFSCISGSANNKKFYLEFQDYVPNCGGAAKQRVGYHIPHKDNSHCGCFFGGHVASACALWMALINAEGQCCSVTR